MNNWVDLNALVKILVGALICGAGLPALFAVGLRALQWGAPAPADPSDDRIVGGKPVGIGAAALCFAVVLAAIGWGIYWIVST